VNTTATKTLETIAMLETSKIPRESAEAIVKAIEMLEVGRDYAPPADIGQMETLTGAEFAELRSEIHKSFRSMETRFIVYLGIILGVMAHGFHWI
jgi:hypothetical protein